MAGRLDDELKDRLRRAGVDFLPAAAAAAMLVQHATATGSCSAMALRFADWFRAHGGAVPPALAELLPKARAAAPPAEPAIDLRAVPDGERPAAATALVRRVVAAVLGFSSPDQLDGDRTFQEQGLDSLMAVDAKDRLEAAAGATLPATLLFDHPDVERLTAHLLQTVAPAAPAGDDVDAMLTEELAKALAAELRQTEAE
jgi:acyl carrier protein